MGDLFLNMDPHSQYLSYLINLGLIGLAVFLINMIVPLIKSIREKKSLQFIFMSSMAIFSISEGIFNLQIGIVFYSLFYSLLIIRDYKGLTHDTN